MIDRFIDAMNEDPRYNGLVGHLRTQREDAVNGLTWTRLKAILKKDDIDRDADTLRKQKRSRDDRGREEKVRGDVICSNCGKRDHLANVCRKSKPWRPRCFKCGGPHLVRDSGLNRKGHGSKYSETE